MELKLTTQTKDGILIVDCTGRIVFGEESSLLRDTVKAALCRRTNASCSTWARSTTLILAVWGSWYLCDTTARNAGSTIKLAKLTKRVGDLLQVTKLLTVFDVHNSEAEAIESFRKVA